MIATGQRWTFIKPSDAICEAGFVRPTRLTHVRCRFRFGCDLGMCAAFIEDCPMSHIANGGGLCSHRDEVLRNIRRLALREPLCDPRTARRTKLLCIQAIAPSV